jgi:hypothetical protein
MQEGKLCFLPLKNSPNNGVLVYGANLEISHRYFSVKNGLQQNNRNNRISIAKFFIS